jgi:dTDP-L-rhamnose 4-epimerase
MKIRSRPTDEEIVNPQNQYAVSKFSQELIALTLGKRYHIPTVAMRYSIVQGPRQSFYNAYSGACRIFCLSLYFDQQPVLYEDGAQLRDYVNIHDVVDANLLVMNSHEADYQVFNVGGGQAYSVSEFAGIVADVYGKDSTSRIPGSYRFGDTRHIVSDIGKLKRLGWSPTRTPKDSVIEYVEWLREQESVEDILEYVENHMKKLNVVRQVSS